MGADNTFGECNFNPEEKESKIKIVEDWMEEYFVVSLLTEKEYKKYKEIFRAIQLNVIETSVRLCAENAKIEYKLEHGGMYGEILYDVHKIDKNSILNCIEILKNQIE